MREIKCAKQTKYNILWTFPSWFQIYQICKESNSKWNRIWNISMQKHVNKTVCWTNGCVLVLLGRVQSIWTTSERQFAFIQASMNDFFLICSHWEHKCFCAIRTHRMLTVVSGAQARDVQNLSIFSVILDAFSS